MVCFLPTMVLIYRACAHTHTPSPPPFHRPSPDTNDSARQRPCMGLDLPPFAAMPYCLLPAACCWRRCCHWSDAACCRLHAAATRRSLCCIGKCKSFEARENCKYGPRWVHLPNELRPVIYTKDVDAVLRMHLPGLQRIFIKHIREGGPQQPTTTGGAPTMDAHRKY